MAAWTKGHTNVINNFGNTIRTIHYMGLLTDTQYSGLRMRRECRERFPRHRESSIPTCVTSWRRVLRASLAEVIVHWEYIYNYVSFISDSPHCCCWDTSKIINTSPNRTSGRLACPNQPSGHHRVRICEAWLHLNIYIYISSPLLL